MDEMKWIKYALTLLFSLLVLSRECLHLPAGDLELGPKILDLLLPVLQLSVHHLLGLGYGQGLLLQGLV